MNNECKNIGYKEAIEPFLYDSQCLIILGLPYLKTNNGYTENKTVFQNKELEIMWEYI